MVNLMIIDGYVLDTPRVLCKDENNYALKFKLATLNRYSKSQFKKYMWVDVITFGSKEKIDTLSKMIEKDDFGTAIGGYSYQGVGKRYYAQLVLTKWDKKFSKGNVPIKETIDIDDDPTKEEEEIDW